MKNKGIIGLIIALLFGGGYMANDTFGRADTAPSCDTASVSVVTVGDELSTRIAATSSLRANITIEQPFGATNTVYISTDEDNVAVVGTGIVLLLNDATNTPRHRSFGLATDFPYTGSITAITDNGSSTLLVTDCRY